MYCGELPCASIIFDSVYERVRCECMVENCLRDYEWGCQYRQECGVGVLTYNMQDMV